MPLCYGLSTVVVTTTVTTALLLTPTTDRTRVMNLSAATGIPYRHNGVDGRKGLEKMNPAL